jgi:hypothetical protein
MNCRVTDEQLCHCAKPIFGHTQIPTAVGAAVGSVVGVCVGMAVGEELGSRVGACVGAHVVSTSTVLMTVFAGHAEVSIVTLAVSILRVPVMDTNAAPPSRLVEPCTRLLTKPETELPTTESSQLDSTSTPPPRA